MAEVVQADYEALAGVAKRFATNASAIQQLHSRLGRQATQLRSAWIGKGSDAFFAEMTDKVLPAVQRLSAALTEAARVTKQIDQVLRDAEEAGAAPFEQAEGGSGAGGEIGDAAGGGGSGDGLGDDFMRTLDEFTRQISIENPGSGTEGAWSEDGYLPGDMDGSGFDQIENDYGFGDAADLGGAGGSGGGSTGGSNDFAVPEDWLDGVTGDSPWSGSGAGGMGEMDSAGSGAGGMGEMGGGGSGSGGEMGAGSGSGGEMGGGAGSGGMPTGAGAGQDGGAGGEAAAARARTSAPSASRQRRDVRPDCGFRRRPPECRRPRRHDPRGDAGSGTEQPRHTDGVGSARPAGCPARQSHQGPHLQIKAGTPTNLVSVRSAASLRNRACNSEQSRCSAP